MRKIAIAAMLICAGILAQAQPYRDTSLSASQRAEDLLQRLSLDQKISLMMNHSPAIPELGIKEYDWWSEALHGAARAGLATVFPQAIGMASSWDPELLEQVFDVASTEQRIKFIQDRREKGGSSIYHGLTVWTPNINIFRDPRWGRGQETYGEDPYLTYRMGKAVVQGLQGQGKVAEEKYGQASYDKLHACLKHFAVHSGPESSRHKDNIEGISWQDLRETYLYAFERLVKETDVQEVMCAYNRVDGKPCCGSDNLLGFFLREKWGYKGLVVSDCGAVYDFYKDWGHMIYPDGASSTAVAVRSGTDLECGDSYRHLKEAVEQGKLSEEEIDRSLRRLLTARFRLGEMDADSLVSWNHIPDSLLACREHSDLALRMARESMVLLSNKGILPLAEGTRLCVLGPNADNAEYLLGNYNGTPRHAVTVLEALQRGHAHMVVTAAEALAAPEDEVIVYVGGINPRIEGEQIDGLDMEGFFGGDRTSIELPKMQRRQIDSLCAAGRKVVMVNMSGSAIALKPENEGCQAILQAWYGGERAGDAVADILFGRCNPCGKLPVTFYASDSDLPDFKDYNMAGRTYRFFEGKPLWAFGHGLSYSTFKYGRARFRKGELRLKLRNTSRRDGAEVVQVYISRDGVDSTQSRMTLRAFKRIDVPAGRRVKVRIPLDSQSFSFLDASTGELSTARGRYTIYYGGASDNVKAVRVTL